MLRQGPGLLSSVCCFWTLEKFIKSLYLPLPHRDMGTFSISETVEVGKLRHGI